MKINVCIIYNVYLNLFRHLPDCPGHVLCCCQPLCLDADQTSWCQQQQSPPSGGGQTGDAETWLINRFLLLIHFGSLDQAQEQRHCEVLRPGPGWDQEHVPLQCGLQAALWGLESFVEIIKACLFYKDFSVGYNIYIDLVKSFARIILSKCRFVSRRKFRIDSSTVKGPALCLVLGSGNIS